MWRPSLIAIGLPFPAAWITSALPSSQPGATEQSVPPPATVRGSAAHTAMWHSLVPGTFGRSVQSSRTSVSRSRSGTTCPAAGGWPSHGSPPSPAGSRSGADATRPNAHPAKLLH
eukprot:746394-Alexandrium_andersonii.AAC.1